MFQRLNQKITLTISVAMTLVVLITSTLAYVILKNIIYDHYKVLVTQCTEQSNKNTRLYMNLMEETTNYFASDPVLMEAIKKEEFDSRILSILDGLRSTNLNILGVSLYTDSGAVYTSSNVTNAPNLSWLIENEIPSGFPKDTEQQSVWTIRYRYLDKSYYINYYPRKKGLFSYIHKIADSTGEFTGYLVVDTNISTLSNFYRSSLSEYFELYESYILTENGSILAEQMPPESELRELNNRSDDKGIQILGHGRDELIVSSDIPSANGDVIIHLALNKLNGRLIRLVILLAILSALLALLSVRISRMLAKSITHPLNHLYRKMKDPLPDSDRYFP